MINLSYLNWNNNNNIKDTVIVIIISVFALNLNKLLISIIVLIIINLSLIKILINVSWHINFILIEKIEYIALWMNIAQIYLHRIIFIYNFFGKDLICNLILRLALSIVNFSFNNFEEYADFLLLSGDIGLTL